MPQTNVEEVVSNGIRMACILWTFTALSLKGQTEEEISKNAQKFIDGEAKKFLLSLDRQGLMIVEKSPLFREG